MKATYREIAGKVDPGFSERPSAAQKMILFGIGEVLDADGETAADHPCEKTDLAKGWGLAETAEYCRRPLRRVGILPVAGV